MAGISISSSPVQLSSRLSMIFVVPCSKVTVFRLEHPSKIAFPAFVSEVGISTDESAVQFLNA